MPLLLLLLSLLLVLPPFFSAFPVTPCAVASSAAAAAAAAGLESVADSSWLSVFLGPSRLSKMVIFPWKNQHCWVVVAWG